MSHNAQGCTSQEIVWPKVSIMQTLRNIALFKKLLFQRDRDRDKKMRRKEIGEGKEKKEKMRREEKEERKGEGRGEERH